MATILAASSQASASVVGIACRSRHSLQQQQQQNPMNVLCCSSQLCPQGVFSGAGSVANVGTFEARNHSQVSYFLRLKQRLRSRTVASAEFHIRDAANATEAAIVPDTFSSARLTSTPVELALTSKFVDTTDLPTQTEDGASLGQEGIPDLESSSPFTSGDFPPESPSVGDVPSVPDAAESFPSTLDPTVDALQSAGDDESMNKAALSAQEEYLRLLGGDKQGLAEQTDDFGDSLKAAQDSIGGSLKAAQDGIDAARDAIAKSVEGVVNAVTGSVNSAVSSVKDAYDSANGSIVKTLKSTTAPLENGATDLQSGADNAAQGVGVDITSVFRVGTPANDALKEFVTAVKSTTESAWGVTGGFVSQAYSTAKDNVPPGVQSFLDSAEEKVSQIAGPVGSAVDQAFVIITDAERAVGLDVDNAVIPVILVVGGSLFLWLSFNFRYGGYSGDLPPSAAFDVLKNENAILVDIRSQEAKEAEGIPDLRRSTRSKFAAVEVIKVEGPVRGLLKNTSNVESLITAAVIRNIKKVNGGSKIIILDTDGGQSKQIARGLRKSGAKRAFRVDGGFKAWVSSGLRVKPEGSQSPLTILQEDAEALVEEVQPTSSGIIAALLGFVVGAYGLYEWEKTLQLIGCLGLASSLYSRASTYESLDDAKADLKILQKPFSLAIQGIVWIGGFVEPKKLQLATSPVSSNVQGRVIQAAAKHGPKPSDLELVGKEPTDDSLEEPGEVQAPEQDEGGEGESTTQSQHTSVKDSE